MSADFDLQHFGDPSEPGAPGHQKWLAEQREPTLVERAKHELSEYRSRPRTMRAEQIHAKFLADLLSEFVQRAEEETAHYTPETQNIRLGYAYRPNLPEGQRHHPPLLAEFDRWYDLERAKWVAVAMDPDLKAETLTQEEYLQDAPAPRSVCVHCQEAIEATSIRTSKYGWRHLNGMRDFRPGMGGHDARPYNPAIDIEQVQP